MTQVKRLTSSRRNFLAGLAGSGLCCFPPSKPQPQRLSPFPDVPPPKFWFDDRVIWKWWAEDPNDRKYEIEMVETGTVIGLARGKNQYYWDKAYECWWYWVKNNCEPDQILNEQMIVEKELNWLA